MSGRGVTPISYHRRRAVRRASGLRMWGARTGVGAMLCEDLHEDEDMTQDPAGVGVDDEGVDPPTDGVADEDGPLPPPVDGNVDDGEDPPLIVRGASLSHTRITLPVHGDDLFHKTGGKWLYPVLATQLTNAMKDRLKLGGIYPNWSSLPLSIKNLIREEWMGRFDFTEAEKVHARREFFQMGSSHMRSIMHLAKAHAKKACGTENVADCVHGGRPTFFTQRTWKALIEYWVK